MKDPRLVQVIENGSVGTLTSVRNGRKRCHLKPYHNSITHADAEAEAEADADADADAFPLLCRFQLQRCCKRRVATSEACIGRSTTSASDCRSYCPLLMPIVQKLPLLGA